MNETKSVYQTYQGNTYLFGGNAPYVEEMYENYLANPGDGRSVSIHYIIGRDAGEILAMVPEEMVPESTHVTVP